MKYDALVVIQVRFNSKRLLGKALLPLRGVPVLVYLIRRLKVLPSSYRIIVATTDRPEDDITACWAGDEGVAVIRGEDQDVLARYIRCVRAFSSDIIVRVTADNPLTDSAIIESVVDTMKKGRYDYVCATKGYPIGSGVDAFSKDMLEKLHINASSPHEREHINAYALNHKSEYRICELPVPPRLNYPDAKLTVDTYEDYKSMKDIVNSFPQNHFIGIEDAIKRAG
jgi:spore coat polysaccharide biosynthesis protein SpsF (cytidylyltransferase family)